MYRVRKTVRDEKNNSKNILNREKKIAMLYRKYSRNETRFGVNHVHHCGHFDGSPHDDLAPLMAWIDERRRENARRQRSQQRYCYRLGPTCLKAGRLAACRS